jgi:two-component system, NtrC family, sensor kinase
MAGNNMMKKRFFLPSLSLRTRFHIGIGAFLILICFVSAFLIYRHEKSLLEEIALVKTDLVMAAVEASRAYVREELRPKMYAEFGPEFFMLEAMSTSYAGRAFMDRFSREVPNFNYRRVSVNARNPKSEAGIPEGKMIDYFRENPGQETGRVWQPGMARPVICGFSRYFSKLPACTVTAIPATRLQS